MALGLTNDDDVELEAALQKFVLNLLRNGVEADVGVGTNLFSGGHDEYRAMGTWTGAWADCTASRSLAELASDATMA